MSSLMVDRYVAVRLVVPAFRPYEDVCRLLIWVFAEHLGTTAALLPLDAAGEQAMRERYERRKA